MQLNLSAGKFESFIIVTLAIKTSWRSKSAFEVLSPPTTLPPPGLPTVQRQQQVDCCKPGDPACLGCYRCVMYHPDFPPKGRRVCTKKVYWAFAVQNEDMCT